MVAGRGLAAVLDELAAVANQRHGAVIGLSERLASGRLRVAVVGEAKRGKSTLVNALLSSSLLPMGVTPVTAVATAVRDGLPPRVVAQYIDGRAEEYPLTILADLVTEAGNPGNRRALASVTACLEAPLLRGGVELIDTPGVGSVYTQATAHARAAHEQLDAAVFVLTADPPMSASERDLLAEIAARAVALFVVLNKVDRLAPDELDQAKRFVAGVLATAVPNATIAVYAISGVAALAGDSGALDGLDVDLRHYLDRRRDSDLSRAVAAHALRIARASLDDVQLTLRVAELAASDAHDRVGAFRASLRVVEQHRRDAADIVRAWATRTSADLDETARAQTPSITEDVRTALLDALDRLTGVAGHIEAGGRAVAGERTGHLVAHWCAERRGAIAAAQTELDERLTAGLRHDLETVRRVAADQLGLPLSLPAPDAPVVAAATVDATYQPDIGYTTDLAATIRRALPARLGRGLVRRVLLDEVDDLVPRQLGRATAAFRDLLAQAARDLTRSIDARYGEATGGLAAALAQAEALATTAADAAGLARAELTSRADTLTKLIDELTCYASVAQAGSTPAAASPARPQPLRRST
ncbi:MAG TPA: dynamin family protein [Micromonosporaceae bacterium]|jgi:GTP-binding protein EngB required for normal cell division